LQNVQVMNATLMPLVISSRDAAFGDHHVLDVLFDDLFVGYAMGDRLMNWQDFGRMQLNRRELRRRAAHALDAALDRVNIHGQPPALMVDFGGIESSLLLADGFWDSLEGAVPGDIVVAVPARDVMIVTGSRSQPGLAKARRAVDRMFFAGGPHLLRPGLLVRHRGTWQPF